MDYYLGIYACFFATNYLDGLARMKRSREKRRRNHITSPNPYEERLKDFNEFQIGVFSNVILNLFGSLLWPWQIFWRSAPYIALYFDPSNESTKMK
mmetsp:Transcript_10867/g.11947  ORF Transcript_10867/g.11947 Transcript_10867/m.11947 type:complete len:96 (+) Transcript_10867:76-363(+)